MSRSRRGARATPPASGADVIPAVAVRQLVDGNEEEIERLRHELADALREAEQAEGRVAAHPGAPLLPLVWPDLHEHDLSDASAAPAPGPRTTVVTRSS